MYHCKNEMVFPCRTLYFKLEISKNAFFHSNTLFLLIILAIVNERMNASLGEPMTDSVSIFSILSNLYLYAGGRMADISAGGVDNLTDCYQYLSFWHSCVQTGDKCLIYVFSQYHHSGFCGFCFRH